MKSFVHLERGTFHLLMNVQLKFSLETSESEADERYLLIQVICIPRLSHDPKWLQSESRLCIKTFASLVNREVLYENIPQHQCGQQDYC